jgi:hypothetical protein
VCHTTNAHEAAGAAGTRHSPRPHWAQGFCKGSGASRREARHRVGNWGRHCEEQRDEAIHSYFFPAMDCFASLAMTALQLTVFGSLKIESVRTRHTLSHHRPRRRAIQYCEAPVMEPRSRGILDTPACAGYDDSLWTRAATQVRPVMAESDLSAAVRRAKTEATKQSILSSRRDGLLLGAVIGLPAGGVEAAPFASRVN